MRKPVKPIPPDASDDFRRLMDTNPAATQRLLADIFAAGDFENDEEAEFAELMDAVAEVGFDTAEVETVGAVLTELKADRYEIFATLASGATVRLSGLFETTEEAERVRLLVHNGHYPETGVRRYDRALAMRPTSIEERSPFDV